MQLTANNKMEIKKVLLRKHDKLKFVVVPRNSLIKEGDYVFIKKVEGGENATD